MAISKARGEIASCVERISQNLYDLADRILQTVHVESAASLDTIDEAIDEALPSAIKALVLQAAYLGMAREELRDLVHGRAHITSDAKNDQERFGTVVKSRAFAGGTKRRSAKPATKRKAAKR